MGEFTITQANPNREKLFLYPSANLTGCVEWTPNGETNNYECVDEEDVDYLDTYISIVSDMNYTDLYNVPNHTTETGTIHYVKVYAVAKVSASPPSDTKFYLAVAPESKCTDYYKSDMKNLVTGWKKLSYVWENNPKDSNAWDWTDIDAMSIGVEGNTGNFALGTTSDETLDPNGDTNDDGWGTGVCAFSNDYEFVLTSNSSSCYLWVQTAADEREFFTMENTSDSSGKTINSVTVYAKAKSTAPSDGADDTLELGLRFGAFPYSYYYGDVETMTGSYAWYSHTWTTNPDTSSSWTSADIDGMEAGFRGNENGSGQVRVQYFYIVVNYDDVGHPEVDVSQNYAEVSYTPDSRTCTLSKPNTWSTDHRRNTKMLNFWNGTREVYDLSRSQHTLVMRGTEYSHDNSFTPCDRIDCVKTFARNGASISISGFLPSYLDGSYRIRSFGWDRVNNKPQVYKWILELEKATK